MTIPMTNRTVPLGLLIFFVLLLSLSAQPPAGALSWDDWLSPSGGTFFFDNEATFHPIEIGTAVEEAVGKDRQLMVLKTELHLLEGRISPFLHAGIPDFSFSYEGEESFGLYSPYQLEHSISAGIEWRVLNGGEARFEKERIRLRKKTLLSLIEDRLAELRLRTVDTALTILRMKEGLLLENHTKELLRLELRSAESLASDQRLTELEREELILEERRIELSLEEKRLALEERLTDFSMLVGMGESDIYVPAGSLLRNPSSFTAGTLPAEETFYREQAALHNAEVQAALREREEVRIGQLSRKRRSLPTAVLYGQVRLNGQALPLHIPSFTVGLNISSSSPLLDMNAGDTLFHSKLEEARSSSALIRLSPRSLLGTEKGEGELNEKSAEALLRTSKKMAAHTAAFLFRNLLLLEKRHYLAVEQAGLGEKRLESAEQQYELGRISLKKLLQAKEEAALLNVKVTELAADRCIRELELLRHCGLTTDPELVLSRYIVKEKEEG
jgi:hypothetical protein